MLGYLATTDICKQLGITDRTLYQYRQQHGFPQPIRFGTRNLYEEAEVNTWINNKLRRQQ